MARKRKNTVERVGDAPEEEVCTHAQHFADPEVDRPPGEYVHTCPGCELKQNFVVPEEEAPVEDG
jgi:hypothetical protein